MAVYTDVAADDLADFLKSYDIGDLLSYKGISEGVENSNYFLQTTAGSFILTLYEKRTRINDLPFFLGLMDHLVLHKINCPRPVNLRSGGELSTLAGRPAAIFSFLEGVWPRLPEVSHCSTVGGALAKLHLAGRNFQMKRDNELSVSSWRSLFSSALDRVDDIQNGLGDLIESELDRLEERWPHELPKGVIHADLFPDNVLFVGNKISGIIDFYFACNDLLAYDVAICINAWCFEPNHSFNSRKAQAFLKGYERIRRLSNAEHSALPLLARGAAMRFLLTRLVDFLNVPVGAFVHPKDPLEYLRKLRFFQTQSSRLHA